MTPDAGFAESITVEDLERDPYPIYARLRREAPVAWVPSIGCWLVTRAAEVERVTTQTEIFTAEAPSSPVDRFFGGRTLMTMDGAEHLELRRTLDEKYRPRRVATYIDDLVQPLADRYVTTLMTKEPHEAELVTEYFEPISVLALAQTLGLGHVPPQRLQEWFHGLSQGATNFEDDPTKSADNATACSDIESELRPLMAEWQAQPDDSAISSMIHHGCPAGQHREVDDLLPSIKVILLGGMQEPGHGAASCLAALFAHPEQMRWIKEHPDSWDDVIHEALRWMAPIGTMQATTVQQTTLGGVTIPEGELISAVVSSACHDEELFDSPHVFDIHRPRTPNAAFGYGPHFCAGHAFARDVERISLRTLVEALPSLELTQPVEFRGWEFRAPTAVHVRW
ncbi:MAG: cytochrome P450 [Candidatus Nanopelagicales bacterium]|nr:cytochrome P450 [Candidatus Nanopelagicales bacterium]MCF8536482.1 cytochrome P450 [Candidatus Nanopelagicales bacterium]MCF8541602.1 cytochrome P450 [Candidatus Nanopelagicales bacterium]MCF8556604.1 cytochrome P450 [Candidatus Nanopelagicales bacterium]